MKIQSITSEKNKILILYLLCNHPIIQNYKNNRDRAALNNLMKQN